MLNFVPNIGHLLILNLSSVSKIYYSRTTAYKLIIYIVRLICLPTTQHVLVLL